MKVKKMNLRGISDILSNNELKNVIGGCGGHTYCNVISEDGYLIINKADCHVLSYAECLESCIKAYAGFRWHCDCKEFGGW